MRTMTLNQLEHVVQGYKQGENVSFDKVSIDTRSLKKGDLFIALKGDNFDANTFVHQAKDKGAAAVVVNEKVDAEIPSIVVTDSLKALTALATAERLKARIQVLAITGSNGKTSVKEMLAAILRQAHSVLVTDGNLNNHIGVPLTLLRLREEHQIAVIEMGASHIGEIKHLCEIARPNIAIINNVGAAHLEGFGSLEGIAKGKGEIISGLPENGIAILNGDDPWFDLWVVLAGKRPIISFGWSDKDDVWTDVKSVRSEWSGEQFETHFRLNYRQQSVPVKLNLIGHHSVLNAMAAASASIALGVSLAEIATGLQKLHPVKGRMQPLKGINNSLIINDCYNANPQSFEVALNCVLKLKKPVWLVLGDFAELGTDAEKIHQQLGRDIADSTVDKLYTVGDMMRYTADSFNQLNNAHERKAVHFSTKKELLLEMKSSMQAGVLVLIKGSRSQGLEDVVEQLKLEECN